MIAIIEAGGTKTEIRYQKDGNKVSTTVSGINPYIHSDAEIQHRIQQLSAVVGNDAGSWKAVYYYGAGCSHPNQIQRIRKALEFQFPNCEFDIQSDLMGAARALCGKNPGLVAILGTGSNACLFDGETITKGMTSFGFWLGDEGSGGHIGKLVFRNWLKGRLPDYETELEQKFGCPASLALEEIYQSSSPNSRMASLAEIAIKNQEHPIFKEVIVTSLKDFFEENKNLWDENGDLAWSFTGSVAWNLRNVISDYLRSSGRKTGIFEASPSERLFLFHNQEQANV